MVEHKIKIDESINMSIEIPEELSLSEFSIITQNLEKITKVFLKQDMKFGEITKVEGVTPKFSRANLSQEELSLLMDIWFNRGLIGAQKQLVTAREIPRLANKSWQSLANLVYNNKNNKKKYNNVVHNSIIEHCYTEEEKKQIVDIWYNSGLNVLERVDMLRNKFSKLYNKNAKEIGTTAWRFKTNYNSNRRTK